MDRDGVLIEDCRYPYELKDLRLIYDIIPHLHWAQEEGFKLLIMTNQSGIARGIFSVQQFEQFQAQVNRKLLERGVRIDGVYYCPYLKGASVPRYDRDSPDRKPHPGMYLKARDDFSLSLEDSFMIGDKLSDRIEYPGLRSYILESSYTPKSGEKLFPDFDSIFREIKHAIHR